MPAVVRVRTVGGAEYEIEKPYFESHPRTPISWERLTEKFELLAEDVCTPAEQERIVDVVRKLENHDAADPVAELSGV